MKTSPFGFMPLACLTGALTLTVQMSVAQAATSVSLPANGLLYAKGFAVKTAGGALNDDWNLWSNGKIEQSINFPANAAYRISVQASGQVALGVWPHMQVLLDNAVVAEMDVGDGSFADRAAPELENIVIPAGVHALAVQFTNDQRSAATGEDRNLLVRSVTFARTSIDLPADGSVHAVDMTSKSVGGAVGNAWNLWSNGLIQQYVNFGAARAYGIKVSARGQLAGGVAPHLKVWLDGKVIGEADVSSTDLKDVVPTGLSKFAIPAGLHLVGLEFTNDARVGSEDRNLIIQGITFGNPIASAPATIAESTSTATLLFDGGFKSGAWAGSLGEEFAAADSAVDVADPVSPTSGRRAVKINLRPYPQDMVNNGNRSEFSLTAVKPTLPDGVAVPGSSNHFAWTIMIPKDYVESTSISDWQVMGQWHDQPDFARGETWSTYVGRSPPLALNYLNGELRVSMHDLNGKETIVGKAALKKGQWYTVDVYVRWSAGTDAFQAVYIGGQPVTPFNGKDYNFYRPNVFNSSGNYFKIGLYRAKTIKATNSLYYGDLKIWSFTQPPVPAAAQ